MKEKSTVEIIYTPEQFKEKGFDGEISYHTKANTLAKNRALENYGSLNRITGNLARDVVLKAAGLSKANPYIAAAGLIKYGVQLGQGNKGQEY
jgi:hypothetical protein